MSQPWYLHLFWILAAGAAGFAVTEIGSARLRLSRPVLLVPYTLVVGGLCWGYLSWSGVDLAALLGQNLAWGLVGAALLSVILVRNVLSQPAGARSGGVALAFEVIWLGVAYGAADGLLLSALPILAVWQAGASLGWTGTPIGDLLFGVLAILASMFLTGIYHAGYVEFRSERMKTAFIGNSVISLGYLLTANPLASVLSHSVMHVSAVLHGPNSVVQLPPHYEFQTTSTGAGLSAG